VINQIGYPIGSFYGLVQDGIFQNQGEVDAHATQDGAAVGRFRFEDTNGDGAVTLADKTIIGNPHPDFTGGLNLSASWKYFDISAFLFTSIGNDIFNMTDEYAVFRLFSSNVREALLTDSWTPDNPDAIYPKMDQNDTYSKTYSSFYVEDGSYLRLRNLQIGFTVPKQPWFQSIRIYLQAQNLFTITGYSGLDPAMPSIRTTGNAGDQTDQGMGTDWGPYPANRIISIGINANF
jgi:hypothetical protein